MKDKPHNSEAEQAVIGSMIMDNRVIPKILSALSADDFYDMRHGSIFSACAELAKSMSPVDHVTVGNLLSEHGLLEKIGGPMILATITDSIVTTANVEHYAKIVKKKAVIRRMIEAAQSVVDAGYEDPSDDEEFLTKSSLAVSKVVIGAERKSDFVTFQDDLTERLDDIVENRENKNLIKTGFSVLDSENCGLIRPLLHVVAAATGMGKSTFLLNLAINLSMAGKKVLYFTLEDSATVQRDRAIARFSGVPVNRIIGNRVTGDSMTRVLQSSASLSKVSVAFYDKPQNSKKLIQLATAYKMEHGLDVVMIDHLGFTLNSGKLYEANAEAIRDFATLGKHLDVVPVVACQFNKDLDRRDDKRPRLSDLANSSTISQDARAIWFLHRPAKYDQEQDPSKMELIVAKSSHGQPGIIGLKCDMARMFIGDPEMQDQHWY